MESCFHSTTVYWFEIFLRPISPPIPAPRRRPMPHPMSRLWIWPRRRVFRLFNFSDGGISGNKSWAADNQSSPAKRNAHFAAAALGREAASDFLSKLVHHQRRNHPPHHCHGCFRVSTSLHFFLTLLIDSNLNRLLKF